MSLEDLIGAAFEAARAHRWGEAGALYARGAVLAMDLGGAEPARRAWSAAGEAWRRDDAPRAAARALRMALQLPAVTGSTDAVVRVRLASALADCGNGDAALTLCRDAVREGTAGDLAVDALVGTILGFGRKAAARALLPMLRSPAASAFRRGELARLDGDLDGARSQFDGALGALDGQPEAESGRAAARAEIGELSLLEGDHHGAAEAFALASALHREAGRRSLAWRCEAARVRALVEGGVAVLDGALSEAIAGAVQRGMEPLEVDLRLARGMALAARAPGEGGEDLERATSLADRCGLRLRAGRARYERATRLALPAGERTALLVEAVALLEDSVPHRARAIAALGAPSVDPASRAE